MEYDSVGRASVKQRLAYREAVRALPRSCEVIRVAMKARSVAYSLYTVAELFDVYVWSKREQL